MKKIILGLVFILVSIFSFGQRNYIYTPKNNYTHGEENGQIFNYTISCTDSSKNYIINFYHFLPCIGDELYNKGKYPINGKIQNEGKCVIKLNNDSIYTFNFYNYKNKYYNYDTSDTGYRYFILTLFINKNILSNIINIGVNKFRIETDIKYLDIDPIFNSNYFKNGYFDIINQMNKTKHKTNIYDNL